ncbi:MAG: PASTA domain-containing protein, partial [Oscillospiraceae bacterium]
MGFDTITESKVIIKEYMPDTLCTRQKGSTVIDVDQKYVAQYKTFMSEFVELNKMLSKMRTLSHIIPVTDLFGDNNTGYAVLTYFDGITLSEYLKNNAGELSWDEVKRLFPPIFTTLSLVHNAGLVHRGICPENILINDNGEIKLTGFAISDERTANTELASELYTGYAAPEQYNSNNWQGTWTDVYGISALLYRVLTGVVPTGAMERMTADNLIEPALLNPNIPKNVSKVIMNGLNLNGEMRIQTITELVTQLFEQPEYNSVRLSSSSTQTIAIPKQYTDPERYPAERRKKKQVSRHSVFITVMAAILGIGLLFLLIMYLAMNGGTSDGGDDPVPSAVTGFDESGIFVSETTVQTIAPMTEAPPPVTSAEANQMIYVMNDLTGKNFELISKSSNYSNLVFNPMYEYNDTVAKGTIFFQSIAKDERYTDGAEITVKVSLGPKYVQIPEYISLSKKDYFALLNNAGIKYEEKELETADVKEGYVAKVSKEPGEKIDVEAGEVLTVFVAVKPPETEAETTKSTKKKKETETEAPIIEDEPEGSISYYN